MLVIAGLSLKNLKPRVWDPQSRYFVKELGAVMVSYAEFHAMPSQRANAMAVGLRSYLGVPDSTEVYLDNGAFFFLSRPGKRPRKAYEEFVHHAKPDWYPIPEEYIPSPAMTDTRQRNCFERTMRVNCQFRDDGFVPVMHVGLCLPDYIKQILSNDTLSTKSRFALGGLVPNLLRAPKAIPYERVLSSLFTAREAFSHKQLHVFGIGGTATVHLAALIGFDSIDSSGWRNRAARGILQLPGRGDRVVAELGNWRGRRLSKEEMGLLARCRCPACRTGGTKGLQKRGIAGFSNRAVHNLWVLLDEARWVEERLRAGTYARYFRKRLENTTYLPLIERALEIRTGCI